MTYAIPVIDLESTDLGAVRAGTEELGAIQVVNHGVPEELSGDLGRRMARLLSLPRAEKARLASPHPYRGWRQWPDDFGRLELERFNVAQFDDVADARAAGVAEEYLGLFGHANLWPDDDPGLREAAARTRSRPGGMASRTWPSWPRNRRDGDGMSEGGPVKGVRGLDTRAAEMRASRAIVVVFTSHPVTCG